MIPFLTSLVPVLLTLVAAQDLCSRPADIFLLLDDSRSIWFKHFDEELSFAQSLVSKFDISESTTRIAAATFSTGVKPGFSFGRYSTVSEVQDAVGKIKQRNGGTTDTFAGIQFARETLLQTSRPGAARILIIITDGVSANRTKTRIQAKETINSGISIIVIGVGKMDKKQLAEMASTPTDKYLFTVSAFPDLSTIEGLVSQQACEVPADQPPPEEECHSKPAEVVFVLDKSNSVYILDFQKQLVFVNDVIDIFDIGPDKTRVAAVSFSTDATVEYHLDEFDNKQDIKDRTSKIIHTGGVTETNKALAMVRDEVLTAEHKVRAKVPIIVITITDGLSQNYLATRAVAKTLKDNGVIMFAIGVGSHVDQQELTDIGLSPREEYVFEVNGYDALNTIKRIIAYRTCHQTL